jgi:antitoxin (DNA-binding transcriptional repressor) of toxin-antitoxin stability system
MYCKEDETHRSFRKARAELAMLCHAQHATIIMNDGHPVAILVPFEKAGYDRYTTKDKRLAAARTRFEGALKALRTQ